MDLEDCNGLDEHYNTHKGRLYCMEKQQQQKKPHQKKRGNTVFQGYILGDVNNTVTAVRSYNLIYNS